MVGLPGEDHAEFARLEQQFLYDFTPIDIVERALVRDLAVLTWKKLRLEKVEYQVLIRQLDEEPSSDDFTATVVEPDSLDKHLPHLDRFTEAARKDVVHARSCAQDAAEKTDWTVEDLQAMQQACPSLYAAVVEHAENLGLDASTPARLLAAPWEDEEGSPIAAIRTAIEEAINDADEWLAVYADLPTIKEEWQALRNQRLMNFMELRAPTRVHDDLSRAFFRTLQELRTHQKWRRSLAALGASSPTSLEGPASGS